MSRMNVACVGAKDGKVLIWLADGPLGDVKHAIALTEQEATFLAGALLRAPGWAHVGYPLGET